jgi:NAD(P)-dependent dehydrogenase (short-subunit alcohol dehydrogenase family)
MNAVRKVVVITGASRGIGAGLVQEFLQRDYRVVACSRGMEQNGDPDVLAIAGDVSDPDFASFIINEAVDRFGRIDTLINNAGIFVPKPFTDYCENDFTALVKVNLGGFFHISQKAAVEMLRQGSGHIVNITSSLVAEQPLRVLPAALTAITKGGINAVTRSLAIEYSGRGIRVNAVAPGAISTPMHPVETHGFLATLHPMGRIGEVREIVDAVLFLEGADFVTGEIVHVDGGAHAGHW